MWVTKAKNVFILWAIVAVATARESPIFESCFKKIDYGKKKSSPLAIVLIIFTLKLIEGEKDILVKSWVTHSELLSNINFIFRNTFRISLVSFFRKGTVFLGLFL